MNEDEYFDKLANAWAHYFKTRGVFEDTAAVNTLGKASDAEVIQARDEYNASLLSVYDLLAIKDQVTKACLHCQKQFTPNAMGFMLYCSQKCRQSHAILARVQIKNREANSKELNKSEV